MYRAERLYQQDEITGDELIEARQRDIVPKFDSLITLVTELHPLHLRQTALCRERR